MNGTTHRAGGICFGAVAAAYLWQLPTTPTEIVLATTFVSASAFGSLLPDIDHHNSTITNQLKRNVRNLLEFPLRMIGIRPKHKRKKKKDPNAQRKKDSRRPVAFRHRGITHSPFLVILVFLLMLLVYPSLPSFIQPFYLVFSIGMFVGMVSHLFLDALTKDGIPIFAPLSFTKFRLMKLTTGRGEFKVVLVMSIIATALICFQIK